MESKYAFLFVSRHIRDDEVNWYITLAIPPLPSIQKFFISRHLRADKSTFLEAIEENFFKMELSYEKDIYSELMNDLKNNIGTAFFETTLDMPSRLKDIFNNLIEFIRVSENRFNPHLVIISEFFDIPWELYPLKMSEKKLNLIYNYLPIIRVPVGIRYENPTNKINIRNILVIIGDLLSTISSTGENKSDEIFREIKETLKWIIYELPFDRMNINSFAFVFDQDIYNSLRTDPDFISVFSNSNKNSSAPQFEFLSKDNFRFESRHIKINEREYSLSDFDCIIIIPDHVKVEIKEEKDISLSGSIMLFGKQYKSEQLHNILKYLIEHKKEPVFLAIIGCNSLYLYQDIISKSTIQDSNLTNLFFTGIYRLITPKGALRTLKGLLKAIYESKKEIKPLHEKLSKVLTDEKVGYVLPIVGPPPHIPPLAAGKFGIYRSIANLFESLIEKKIMTHGLKIDTEIFDSRSEQISWLLEDDYLREEIDFILCDLPSILAFYLINKIENNGSKIEILTPTFKTNISNIKLALTKHAHDKLTKDIKNLFQEDLRFGLRGIFLREASLSRKLDLPDTLLPISASSLGFFNFIYNLYNMYDGFQNTFKLKIYLYDDIKSMIGHLHQGHIDGIVLTEGIQKEYSKTLNKHSIKVVTLSELVKSETEFRGLGSYAVGPIILFKNISLDDEKAKNVKNIVRQIISSSIAKHLDDSSYKKFEWLFNNEGGLKPIKEISLRIRDAINGMLLLLYHNAFGKVSLGSRIRKKLPKPSDFEKICEFIEGESRFPVYYKHLCRFVNSVKRFIRKHGGGLKSDRDYIGS